MNTKSNHTPGPLIIDETIGVNGLPVYLIEDCDGDPVARVNHKPDAILFASAPELLAALQQMLPMFAQYVKLTTEGAPTYLVARAAIAKAKGETNDPWNSEPPSNPPPDAASLEWKRTALENMHKGEITP